MFCSKRRKEVLLFFLSITLLCVIFKEDVFLCSPWEQLTVLTWEPFDDYLFCTQGKQRIPACMLNITKQLKGRLVVDTNISENAMVHDHHKDIQPGGMWEPSTCVSCYHVAIIIPYRDRYNHLKILLHFLIPLLQRQHIKFRIFVVEQKGNKLFNRGRMMNVGFKEAMKLGDFDCFIFHDVDLIPEDDRNIYTCSSLPRHMSVAIDKFKYKLPYHCIVGGVLSFRGEHFQKVNGYSNMYWGWGAEDDDMYRRFTLLATAKKRFHRDGLNSLDYHVTLMNNTQLFTHIVVDIDQPPPDLLN